jgi:diaminopimelate epimerase
MLLLFRGAEHTPAGRLSWFRSGVGSEIGMAGLLPSRPIPVEIPFLHRHRPRYFHFSGDLNTEHHVRALRFYKAVPGGNPTILVLDPVSPAERAGIARTLMDAGHIQAEQVGFLDLDARPVRLNMMGGEFCGNASRATAAVMAREGAGLAPCRDGLRGELSVSGADAPVAVMVEESGECWAEMPMPDLAGDGAPELEPGIAVVRVPGITHLLLDENRHAFPADFAGAAAALRERFGLDGEAVGCIWYRTEPFCAIRPVVWVRSTASTHYETGCGSGSLALALWLGHGKKFPMDLQIMQPSGNPIGVRIDAGEHGPRAWIHGPVALVARGEAYV